MRTMTKEKLLVYFTGTVVAIAMTALLYSLTDNPRDGWDLHAADILLPVLLFVGWSWRLLRRPHWSVLALGGLFVLSAIWSVRPELTLYTSLKLTLILITFSTLREVIWKNRKEFFAPIIIIGAVALAGSLIAQNILGSNSRAWGVSGSPNVTSGHAMILLLNTSLWLAPVWGVLLATTGSRAALLAFLVVVPVLLRSQKLLIILVLLILIPSALLFGNAYQYLRDPVNQEGRWDQWVESVERIGWIGEGFDTTTQEKATNPHNVYLLLLQELGTVFGAAAIGLLAWNCRTPTMAAILVVCIFDHYFLTTAQGTYLLGSMMAIAQVRERKVQRKEESHGQEKAKAFCLQPIR